MIFFQLHNKKKQFKKSRNILDILSKPHNNMWLIFPRVYYLTVFAN